MKMKLTEAERKEKLEEAIRLLERAQYLLIKCGIKHELAMRRLRQ